MDQKSLPSSRSRRDLLTTTSLLAAAAASPRTASALAAVPASQSGEKPASPGAMLKIPIGVFDPAFPNLSLEEMIDKFAGWAWRRSRSARAAIPIGALSGERSAGR